MSLNASASSGEVGQIVLYVCPSQHNATHAVCEPGDVHAAIVAEVLNRDSAGKPVMALLALLTPYQPTIQWVRAARAVRTPGAGATVTRLMRGAPLAASGTTEATDNDVIYQLDFELGTWHPGDE